MLVVRGTKKLRDRVKGPVATDGNVSSGVLGDWLRMAGTPIGPLFSTHDFPDRALSVPRFGGGRRNRQDEVGHAVDAPAGSVFQVKVTLLNTKPPVWRRILIDGSTTLDGLHEVIQAAFGWWNHHLHEFEIVTVEKVTQADPCTQVPDCIGGRRACPPEDCGGPWGYQDLLDSLAGRPGNTDARLHLVGPDFDPTAFDPNHFALDLANIRNTGFDL